MRERFRVASFELRVFAVAALVAGGVGAGLVASRTAEADPRQAPTPAGALPETPLHCQFKPPAGVTFDDGVVTEVVDGDTITVERTIRLRVRLPGCWAPETRTSDAAEKRLGLKSKTHLAALALGRRCTVHIPTADVAHLGEVTSLGRFVGEVWIEGDDQTLSARQVEARQASTTKGGALGK